MPLLAKQLSHSTVWVQWSVLPLMEHKVVACLLTNSSVQSTYILWMCTGSLLAFFPLSHSSLAELEASHHFTYLLSIHNVLLNVLMN